MRTRVGACETQREVPCGQTLQEAGVDRGPGTSRCGLQGDRGSLFWNPLHGHQPGLTPSLKHTKQMCLTILLVMT